MNFSSKLIEDAVQAFASLPGIGKKTALRLVLHLMNQEEEKKALETERPSQPRTIRSQDLLAGEDEVQIEHDGEFYRLRLTRSGKLILHK